MIVSVWVMNFSPYECPLLRIEIHSVWEQGAEQNIYVYMHGTSNNFPSKLYNKELHNVCSSQNIFRTIKPSRTRWTELFPYVGEKEYVIWGRKLNLFLVFTVLYFLKERKWAYDITRLRMCVCVCVCSPTCTRMWTRTQTRTRTRTQTSTRTRTRTRRVRLYMCLCIYMCVAIF
jgi:hypothetical protein